jgi:putative transposase
MAWKWHSPEQIVDAIAQVRMARLNGLTLSQAIRPLGVSEATYFRWQALYGKLEPEEIARAVRRERDWRYPEIEPAA